MRKLALLLPLFLGLATPVFAACPANTGNMLTTGTDDQVSRDAVVGGCNYLSGMATNVAGGSSLTDASIASATGASQTLVAAVTARRVLNVTNVATHSWWINESGGTASANCAGCFELVPGARWTPRPAPTNAVTGIGAATDKLSIATGS